MSYHSNKRESDTVCRRRWLRKVTQDKPGHRIVFNVKSMDDHSQGKHQSPRIFLLFKGLNVKHYGYIICLWVEYHFS